MRNNTDKYEPRTILVNIEGRLYTVILKSRTEIVLLDSGFFTPASVAVCTTKCRYFALVSTACEYSMSIYDSHTGDVCEYTIVDE